MNEINMPTAEGGKVAGLFPNEGAVERALTAAEELGYERANVHLVTQETNAQQAADETPAAPERGATSKGGPWQGALIGAAICALLGVSLGLFLNGAGVIAIGPVLAALLAGGVGAVAGLYIGSLLGVGLPEGREKTAQKAVQRGAILLSVSPRTAADAQRLKDEWGRLGARVIPE